MAIATSIVGDLLVPTVVACSAAFALIPVGSAIAWFGLLAMAGALGRIAGRGCGTTAAITAGLLYMWAHGHPRFASTITDQWAIRFGFLLGALGAVAAALADWHRRRRLQDRLGAEAQRYLLASDRTSAEHER